MPKLVSFPAGVPRLHGLLRLYVLQILLQYRAAFRFHLFIARAQRQRLLQKRLRALQDAKPLLHEIAAPYSFLRLCPLREIIGLQAALHPRRRIDLTAHDRVALLRQREKPPVIAPIAERVDHRGKVRLLLHIGVPLRQRIAQNLRAQRRRLLLIGNTEVRRQLRFHGILPQDRLAEGVYSGDLREIHPRHLPLQVAVIRLFGQLLRDPRGAAPTPPLWYR